MAEKEAQPGKDAGAGRKPPCEVTFHVGDQPFTGTSIHFSERGILVMSKTPAPLNAKLKLILQFPGFKNALELKGEVVWSNIYGAGDSLSPKGMGVKFMNVERDMERLLAELATQYECAGSVYSCYYT
ncbi:MAG: PilZ domain-containing protein [Syntrophobacter sp.]